MGNDLNKLADQIEEEQKKRTRDAWSMIISTLVGMVILPVGAAMQALTNGINKVLSAFINTVARVGGRVTPSSYPLTSFLTAYTGFGAAAGGAANLVGQPSADRIAGTKVHIDGIEVGEWAGFGALAGLVIGAGVHFLRPLVGRPSPARTSTGYAYPPDHPAFSPNPNPNLGGGFGTAPRRPGFEEYYAPNTSASIRPNTPVTTPRTQPSGEASAVGPSRPSIGEATTRPPSSVNAGEARVPQPQAPQSGLSAARPPSQVNAGEGRVPQPQAPGSKVPPSRPQAPGSEVPQPQAPQSGVSTARPPSQVNAGEGRVPQPQAPGSKVPPSRPQAPGSEVPSTSVVEGSLSSPRTRGSEVAPERPVVAGSVSPPRMPEVVEVLPERPVVAGSVSSPRTPEVVEVLPERLVVEGSRPVVAGSVSSPRTPEVVEVLPERLVVEGSRPVVEGSEGSPPRTPGSEVPPAAGSEGRVEIHPSGRTVEAPFDVEPPSYRQVAADMPPQIVDGVDYGVFKVHAPKESVSRPRSPGSEVAGWEGTASRLGPDAPPTGSEKGAGRVPGVLEDMVVASATEPKIYRVEIHPSGRTVEAVDGKLPSYPRVAADQPPRMVDGLTTASSRGTRLKRSTFVARSRGRAPETTSIPRTLESGPSGERRSRIAAAAKPARQREVRSVTSRRFLLPKGCQRAPRSQACASRPWLRWPNTRRWLSTARRA